MSALRESFDERVEEVHSYMDFLNSLEAQVQTGSPSLAGDEDDHGITPQQQKLLYASVYLQLYNLVEATATLCVESVATAARNEEKWKPHDLAEPLRREWVRSTARTHIDLSYPKRLNAAIAAVDFVVEAHPVSDFVIEKGGGGNWDDAAIEEMSNRLGCQLKVSPSIYSLIKRPVKDDLGPLALVKSRRNSLAHGSMSFAESASEVTVSDLKALVNAVVDYLDEVVRQFDSYVEDFEFLVPESRPRIPG